MLLRLASLIGSQRQPHTDPFLGSAGQRSQSSNAFAVTEWHAPAKMPAHAGSCICLHVNLSPARRKAHIGAQESIENLSFQQMSRNLVLRGFSLQGARHMHSNEELGVCHILPG